MGVDLKWLVLDGYSPENRHWAYSHTMLEVGRDYQYFGKLDALPSAEAPIDLYSCVGKAEGWADRCYGKTQETPYGERLRMVQAKDIAGIEHELDPRQHWLRAAIAYVCALPPDTWIALYWH